LCSIFFVTHGLSFSSKLPCYSTMESGLKAGVPTKRHSTVKFANSVYCSLYEFISIINSEDLNPSGASALCSACSGQATAVCMRSLPRRAGWGSPVPKRSKQLCHAMPCRNAQNQQPGPAERTKTSSPTARGCKQPARHVPPRRRAGFVALRR
jgi:hypothetical protein